MLEHCGRAGTNRSDCSDCPGSDPPAETQPTDRPLDARRPALLVGGLFLGPSILALLGAVCLSAGPVAQLLGAAGGLVVGAGGSVGVARLLRQAKRKTP